MSDGNAPKKARVGDGEAAEAGPLGAAEAQALRAALAAAQRETAAVKMEAAAVKMEAAAVKMEAATVKMEAVAVKMEAAAAAAARTAAAIAAEIWAKFAEPVRLLRARAADRSATSSRSRPLSGQEAAAGAEAAAAAAAGCGGREEVRGAAPTSEEAPSAVRADVPAADGSAAITTCDDDKPFRMSRVREGEFNTFVDTWKPPSVNAGELQHLEFDPAAYEDDVARLKDHRGDGHGIDEKKQTQPFVNRVVRTALPTLRVAVGETLSNRNECLLFYQETSDADAVDGVVCKGANLARKPDAAFFVRDKSAEDDVQLFDGAAQRASLVTIEAKRTLDTSHLRTALVECERDFVEVAGRVPAAEMRVGHSIITSGVEWYFVRMWWTKDHHGDWKREIKVSKKVDVSEDGGWSLLGKWLLFVLREAAGLPSESTKLRPEAEFLNKKGDKVSYELTAVLSKGARSTVSRWKGADGDSIVLKSPVPADEVERIAKLVDYFENEAKTLRQLADRGKWFPKLITDLYSVPPTVAIFVSDGGDALDLFDISGARGKMLANVVKLDIWQGAVPALKRLALCHCDIWASNIVVKGADDKKTAVLVDWESAVPFGKDTRHSPVHTSKKNRALVGEPGYDKKCTKSVLWFLWSPKWTAFDCTEHDKNVGGGISDLAFDGFLND